MGLSAGGLLGLGSLASPCFEMFGFHHSDGQSKDPLLKPSVMRALKLALTSSFGSILISGAVLMALQGIAQFFKALQNGAEV